MIYNISSILNIWTGRPTRHHVVSGVLTSYSQWKSKVWVEVTGRKTTAATSVIRKVRLLFWHISVFHSVFWLPYFLLTTNSYCCHDRQTLAHNTSFSQAVKNTSQSKEETDNTPTEKTEQVTADMKQGLGSHFLRNSNNKYYLWLFNVWWLVTYHSVQTREPRSSFHMYSAQCKGVHPLWKVQF